MTVTRDVIYDLLPGYFAGELSADGKALVEAFFASDPEFARMAERFRTLFAERRAGSADSTAAREKVVFERARSVRTSRDRAFGIAVGATGGALVALFLGALFPLPVSSGMGMGFGFLRVPLALVVLVFGAIALAGWVAWLISRFRVSNGA